MATLSAIACTERLMLMTGRPMPCAFMRKLL